MKKNNLFRMSVAIILMAILCACGNTDAATLSDNTSEAQGEETKVTLYADFSGGSSSAECIKTKEEMISGDLTVEVLAQKLSDWTGLDFIINGAEISSDSVTVDWAVNSTLVAGLDDREQKEDFHFFDAESLNWFMMDSLLGTIKENFAVSTVYYSMDGGKSLVFEGMTGLMELPVDQPYEGSAFFISHADNIGDMDDTSLDNEDTKGEMESKFIFTDTENQILLMYPNLFSEEGVTEENGCIRFAAQQGDSVLFYWVTPNTYDEKPASFMERADANDVEELPGNVVIGTSEDMNYKTGKMTPYAYYWVVEKDWYANVAIECASLDEACQWLEAFKEGAIYIENIAGIDGSGDLS